MLSAEQGGQMQVVFFLHDVLCKWDALWLSLTCDNFSRYPQKSLITNTFRFNFQLHAWRLNVEFLLVIFADPHFNLCYSVVIFVLFMNQAVYYFLQFDVTSRSPTRDKFGFWDHLSSMCRKKKGKDRTQFIVAHTLWFQLILEISGLSFGSDTLLTQDYFSAPQDCDMVPVRHDFCASPQWVAQTVFESEVFKTKICREDFICIRDIFRNTWDHKSF